MKINLLIPIIVVGVIIGYQTQDKTISALLDVYFFNHIIKKKNNSQTITPEYKVLTDE